MFASFSELEGIIAVQKTVTDTLADDRNKLQVYLSEVEATLEDQLQYSRRNQLIIHGVAETTGREDTDDTVIKIFKEMDVEVTKKEINRSHRLGRSKQTDVGGNEKKRPIIVSFISYQHKKLIYDNKKKLKGKKQS